MCRCGVVSVFVSMYVWASVSDFHSFENEISISIWVSSFDIALNYIIFIYLFTQKKN